MKRLTAWLQQQFPLSGHCLHCEVHLPQPGSIWLCDDCKHLLPHWLDGICLSCGVQHKNQDCEETWAMNLDGFNAMFAYKEPMIELVTRFKYGRNLNAGRLLKNLVREYLRLHPKVVQGVDLLLPVPTQAGKLLRRGLNVPAFLIDQPGLPLALNALKKRRRTRVQAALHSRERQRNLSHAFQAVPEWVADQRILIFDDVCTTGATLEEIAHTCKKAGAAEVRALVLARVVKG